MSEQRPFANGTERQDWMAHNCVGCAHYEYCDILEALVLAPKDGTVSAAIAKRMGYPDRAWRDGLPVLGWPCPEREPPRGEGEHHAEIR